MSAYLCVQCSMANSCRAVLCAGSRWRDSRHVFDREIGFPGSARWLRPMDDFDRAVRSPKGDHLTNEFKACSAIRVRAPPVHSAQTHPRRNLLDSAAVPARRPSPASSDS
jgi:hypothetical protein